MPTELNDWLEGLPVRGGHLCISEPRRFQHDETAYDAQYGNEPTYLDCGRGAVGFAREHGVEEGGPVLEIGCGTGFLSLGLVHEDVFPAVLLTDPSPVFLEMTKDRLTGAGVPTNRTRFAVLQAEDIDRLPEGLFSLVVLRSALHHILHVDRFFHGAARALRPGGAVIFQEPCREGFVLMGAMAQFLPALCAAAGAGMTGDQRKRLDGFVEAMRFYARRDVDKSRAEDKHAFRVDDLMGWAGQAGLTLEFSPNTSFEHFQHPPGSRPEPDRFRKFFHEYLKYCMSFDESLMALFDRHLGPYCDWVDGLCAAESPPHMHGVFVARRPKP